MNKLNNIKTGLFALIMCLPLSLCGCENGNHTDETAVSSAETQQSEEVSAKEVMIDYGDAESFEAALNEGKNLEGKVVRFVAGEFHPDSKLGYNVYAGKHLNFVSSRNPDIQKGDTVTVKTTTIENLLGSWIINYEKVDNAVVTDNTITYSKPEETTTAATATATEEAADEPVEAETSAAADDTIMYSKTEETTATTSAATEEEAADEPVDEKTENTYMNNEYYDIVEVSSFQDAIGNIIAIHKLFAKKNVSITSTILLYAPDGSVIGKSSDEITLTEGKYNYFRYSFENDISDISDATYRANANAKKDSFMVGDRNAVEMVQYDMSGDELYITFEQTGDELGSRAKFKILFYKGDKIVDTEEGHFSIYAENLNGKGSTDVAEIWTFGIDYDRIEYIFEP